MLPRTTAFGRTTRPGTAGRLSGGRARPFGIVRFGEDWPERIRGRPLPEPERSLAGPGCPPGSAGPTAMGTGRERAEMKRTRLFAQAPGLERPWYVESTAFDAGERRLDIHLNFEVGGTFACGGCGSEGCKAYDTALKEWRHLDFFRHRACLHAPSPRVKCPECGVRQARLPWARPRSGFTLLFEALVVTMASGMPVKAVARIVEEHDTRLWRIVKHHVDEARAEADHSQVRAVGVDEKACRRGHSCVTFFADLDERRLLYAAEGRKSEVPGEFRDDLEARGGRAEGIGELCMDMSAAYIRGAKESFPDAEVTFDRFHVVKLLNEAVERVRRAEQKERPDLKRTRWLWLWNPERLKPHRYSDLKRRTDES